MLYCIFYIILVCISDITESRVWFWKISLVGVRVKKVKVSGFE